MAYGAFLVLSGVWWLWKDPAQLRERDRVAANVKTWDKVIVRAYWPCRVLTVVIAGLDAGRFRWSSVPLPVEALGWLGQVGGECDVVGGRDEHVSFAPPTWHDRRRWR